MIAEPSTVVRPSEGSSPSSAMEDVSLSQRGTRLSP
jgi:hypothetical protein